jgi:hypothetical protein
MIYIQVVLSELILDTFSSVPEISTAISLKGLILHLETANW